MPLPKWIDNKCLPKSMLWTHCKNICKSARAVCKPAIFFFLLIPFLKMFFFRFIKVYLIVLVIHLRYNCQQIIFLNCSICQICQICHVKLRILVCILFCINFSFHWALINFIHSRSINSTENTTYHAPTPIPYQLQISSV